MRHDESVMFVGCFTIITDVVTWLVSCSTHTDGSSVRWVQVAEVSCWCLSIMLTLAADCLYKQRVTWSPLSPEVTRNAMGSSGVTVCTVQSNISIQYIYSSRRRSAMSQPGDERQDT